MIKNIIFDFDGVLVDSEILVARSFSKYLSKMGIKFTEEEFSFYAGKKTIQVIDDLSIKFNIKNKQSFFDDIMNIANNIYNDELKSVKGAKEFLVENHFNYFIGSNSLKKRILIGLKKVNFDKYIKKDKVFSFDMVDRPKPYPDIYLKVINEYKLNKDETIIIEDSSVGVQSAHAAGIKVLGLTAGQHWYSGRSNQELLDSGAYTSVNSYDKILSEIKKL